MFEVFRYLARRDDEPIRGAFEKFSPRLRGVHLKMDDLFAPWLRDYWEVAPRFWPRRRWFSEEFLNDPEAWLRHKPEPPGWKNHIKGAGYKSDSPMCLVAAFRRREDLKMASEMPRVLETKEITYNIVYEWRPACVAYALFSASESIQRRGGTMQGTLGGFLQDVSTKEDYAVTCGHVAEVSGATLDIVSKSSSSIGTASLWTVPNQTGARSCNNRAFPSSSPASGTTPPVCLDVAVAKMNPVDIANGSIPGIGRPHTVTSISSMNPRDPVKFNGQTSHLTAGELDALCLWHEIDLPDPANPGAHTSHCFGDIFSLCTPRPWYVNTALARPGDSGAWVVCDSRGVLGWDGMIMAGDGAHAYACFAENIMAYAQASNPNLILPP